MPWFFQRRGRGCSVYSQGFHVALKGRGRTWKTKASCIFFTEYAGPQTKSSSEFLMLFISSSRGWNLLHSFILSLVYFSSPFVILMYLFLSLFSFAYPWKMIPAFTACLQLSTNVSLLFHLKNTSLTRNKETLYKKTLLKAALLAQPFKPGRAVYPQRQHLGSRFKTQTSFSFHSIYH